jgi:uncharacterized protein
MKRKEVYQLKDKGIFEGNLLEGELQETNISWVILTKSFAFKIKKEIKLSFLDYSTLDLRKKYCQKELELNRRFSPIYLSVQPIKRNQKNWTIGDGPGDIVDYAVCMQRMDSDKRLDVLLQKGNLPDEAISNLAKQVAQFHQKATIITTDFDLQEAKNLFNDLTTVQDTASEELSSKYAVLIDQLILFSDDFLNKYSYRFIKRTKDGFKKDVHGDLHCGNIFIMEEPVIFDCIEFQDAFRQIDILYEIAFLCMDLEFFGRKDLSDLFLGTYKQLIPCFQNEEDNGIFLYYKCLRANVRAKVFLLNSISEENPKKKVKELQKAKKYLDLASSYMQLLTSA